MKTVCDFYMECDLLPLDARVNLYDADTKKKIIEDWQDLKKCTYDDHVVVGYKWNSITNLLMIWCRESEHVA